MDEMQLRYGRSTVVLPAGRVSVAEVLSARVPRHGRSPEAIVEEALARPTGSPPLRELVRAGDSVAVLVSDITRYSATELFLGPLLRETDVAGVPRSRVTVFVARGTHRAQTAGELREIIGPEIDSGVGVEQADPDGPVTDLGTTARGTRVLVSRRVVEHDRIVLTGTISFHYFAGFGGGRKALVPGCAARATAAATHFRIFNADAPGKHPCARSGVLEGNPVHEDIVDAVGRARPAFLLNTLLAPDGSLFDAVAGDWRQAHAEACRRYAGVFRRRLERRYPLVIASAGGFPKDINFIQSHKALDHAFHAVQPGGVLVLLAECPDGFGSPTFFPWFRFPDPDVLERELRANYRIYGQTAHATMVKARACRVILVSALAPDDVRAMGMTPAASLPEALERASALLAHSPPAVVIPEAGYVLPEVA